MRKTLVIIFFLLTGTALFSQNLIGHTRSEIEKIMKEDYKKFRISSSTKNPIYRYLKYENNIKTETLLFFLSEEDVCTYYKFVGDYSSLNTKIGELNEKHKKIDEHTWVEVIKGEKFRIELEKGEWFFTLTTRKAEN
jgi:hypothetical protein